MRPISKPSASASASAFFEREAELLTLHFQAMLVRWGSNTPARTGLHASFLLVPDKEWCTRRHVLSELFPSDAQQPSLQSWDWRRSAIFENGWSLHKRWQRVFEKFARVVMNEEQTIGDNYMPAPELDLTHYDPERNLFFSPDAIIDFGSQRYVVEIKGIKQESFVELTDDLQTAMDSCETVHKAFYQCQLYMHFLELTRGIILVENKNTQDFKLWVIEYDREAVKPAIERIYAVKRSLALHHQKHAPPARSVCCQSRGDALARQCPMSAKCFSMEEK